MTFNTKPVVWIGDSLEKLKAFPIEVRKDVGLSLYVAQHGVKPEGAKVLKGIGKGIIEIRSSFDTNTYRVIYAVKIADEIYVLDSFQKKSKSGKATAPRDIERIKRRYKTALELSKGE